MNQINMVVQGGAPGASAGSKGKNSGIVIGIGVAAAATVLGE